MRRTSSSTAPNANGDKLLDNTVTSHRWSTDDNQNGQTLCVSKKNYNKPASFNGWLFTPVQINGASNSANILAACRAAKLQTPCDHANYNEWQLRDGVHGRTSVLPAAQQLPCRREQVLVRCRQRCAVAAQMKLEPGVEKAQREEEDTKDLGKGVRCRWRVRHGRSPPPHPRVRG